MIRASVILMNDGDMISETDRYVSIDLLEITISLHTPMHNS
jgi:hypothetical protein